MVSINRPNPANTEDTDMNFKAFIDDECGGAQALQQSLSGTPCEVPVNTVHKWRQRNMMPGDALALMLHMLEAEAGKPVSLKPYFMEAQPCPLSPKKPSSTGSLPDVFG